MGSRVVDMYVLALFVGINQCTDVEHYYIALSELQLRTHLREVLTELHGEQATPNDLAPVRKLLQEGRAHGWVHGGSDASDFDGVAPDHGLVVKVFLVLKDDQAEDCAGDDDTAWEFPAPANDPSHS